MGTWEVGIYQNDLSADVKDDYISKLKAGKSDEQALAEMLDEYKEEADDIQDAEYEEIIDKSAKSNKLAEIAAKAAGVKDHPRPEQPTDQTQDYANNKPTRKSLL